MGRWGDGGMGSVGEIKKYISSPLPCRTTPIPRSDTADATLRERQPSPLCSSIFFASMNQNPIEVGDIAAALAPPTLT